MTGGDGSHHAPRSEDNNHPTGRDVKDAGNPLRICEMLATLDGPVYIERVPDDPKNVLVAKKAIQKAFRTRSRAQDFPLWKLSMCPTDWGMTAPGRGLGQGPYDEILSAGVFKDKAHVK
jgi:2-oxoglutarate ferredoxin oxidoreductase subunit beta